MSQPTQHVVRNTTSALIRSRPWLAALLVVLFVIGAVIVARHWAVTPWAVRADELSGRAVQRGAAEFGLAETFAPAVGILLLTSGGLLGNAVFATPVSRKMARAATWILVVLAAAHVLESWLAASSTQPTVTGPVPWRVLALQGAAFFGFGLLPVTALVAGLGALVAVIRLVTAQSRRSQPWDPTPSTAPAPPGKDCGNWLEGYVLPRQRRTYPGSLGICLSGGGIRSASFALGAVQALQRTSALDERPGRSELTRARYLTAVSGGAYTAGALLLAQDQPEPGRRLPLDDLFAPGSVEFDHLRKHSSYFADGLREWTVAALVVLRGALIATLSLAMVAYLGGRWVGHLYHAMHRAADLQDPWQPAWGALFAVLATACLSVLLWGLSCVRPVPQRLRGALGEGAFSSAVALAVLVLLGAVVPVVAWVSTQLVHEGGGAGDLLLPGAAKGGALGTLGVAVAAVGLVSRQRQRLLKAVRDEGGPLRRLGDFGRTFVQWLAVISGLGIVLAVYLVIFGYTTHRFANLDPTATPRITWGSPDWSSPVPHVYLTLLLSAGLVLLYVVTDETVSGLHPFYRRRLATAFAVRRRADADNGGSRTTRTEQVEGGVVRAEPYDWEQVTRIDTFGRVPRGQGPQVIFCASAHCSDPEMTPPGRHVLPFTLSYDAVGGPELGWCPANRDLLRTGKRALSERLQDDFTVQSAMAISGAAFASASGTAALPANVLLSLLNARLGVWMPAPRTVGPEVVPRWWQPRPPRLRRMSYLVREVFGWYPRQLPLVFVSDGGHYENLGLVELLRHRCGEIYCFDASSDTQAFADSLGKAITLAYDELGVEIELLPEAHEADAASGPAEAVADHPGGPHALEDSVVKRLKTSPVITARITYPSSLRVPWDPTARREGVLVVGRAVLDKTVPWQVLRHAASHPLFPQDATGDQWFDDDKFNAYTTLGRHVGGLAVEAMRSVRPEEQARRRRPPPHPGRRRARGARAGDSNRGDGLVQPGRRRRAGRRRRRTPTAAEAG